MTPTSPASTPFARPQRAEPAPENRGSMLRASILESALELGVGTNRTVAHWIFNPVDEVNEEEDNEDIVSPSLTYTSTTTSEESNLSAGLPHNAQPGAGILINGKDTHINPDPLVQYSKRNGLLPAGVTPESTQRTLQFDLRVTPEPRPISPAPKNRLRKAKPDGYDSDGGYMSESRKAKKEKEKKEKKKSKKKKDKEGDGGAPSDYESEGGYLSETSGKKKKGKKEKKDKSKSKNTESPTSEYETDKSFTSAFTRSRSRKQSVTSPVSGEESDGGYLSESSKKRRFFRLNSKSRKKQDSFDSSQDQPPPVPALPNLTLPIHEKFSRAGTPLVSDSRSVTPVPSETLSVRPSVETFISADTTTSADMSVTTDTSSTTVESEEKRDSILSTDGLTRAFRDAESVRSPSIDFLSTFRRPSPGGPLSPTKFLDRGDGPATSRPPIPPLSSSTSARARPKISAPNTISLAPKHTPLPLTLTPPTPTSSHPASRYIPPSPDPDYVLVTPNSSTHHAAGDGHQSSPSVASNASAGSSGGPPSPIVPRPHVLAYYDLPPPSPPPRGPLPDVPSDISRSTSPSLSMMESTPSSRFPRPMPTVASPIERPNTLAPHPLSREISRDVPTIAQPVPPAQRGRISPFPTAPVLPREQTTTLMRQTSKLTQEAVTRALRNGAAPTSANLHTNDHGRWPSNEKIGVPSEPSSAQPYYGGDWPVREQPSRVQLQPRSTSALDSRHPRDHRDEDGDDGRSWLVYDDDDEQDMSDLSLSAPPTRSASTEPPEPSPDVNTILAGFRAQRDAQLAGQRDGVATRDTLAGIVAEYGRDTLYLDADEEGGDRSSVWSEANSRNSRYSFLDGEKSATIRAKFVKRVEVMYGKDLVPPVPRLDQGLSSRSG